MKYQRPRVPTVASACTVIQNQIKCACVFIDWLLDANE
jgi:hypothetical protein